METTIDRKVHSVDKEGVLTCEKRNHTRDFIWCGTPADREAVTKSCHHCFTFLKFNSGVSGGETRCHGVDPNAAGAVLQRQGARKVRNGTLCRIVSTQPPVSTQTGCGRHVNEGALRFQEMRQCFAGTE